MYSRFGTIHGEMEMIKLVTGAIILESVSALGQNKRYTVQ